MIITNLYLCKGFAQLNNRCGFDFDLSSMVSSSAEDSISKWISTARIRNDREYIIPVVFHVVWYEEQENLEYEQIVKQLNALNDAFAGKNEDRSLVPSLFQPVLSTSTIQFCLANRDPDGNHTNGITRTQTPIRNIGRRYNLHYDDLGGKNIWDPKKYLNVWVCNVDDSRQSLGSATNPFIITTDIKFKDGVAIDYRAFGVGGKCTTSY